MPSRLWRWLVPTVALAWGFGANLAQGTEPPPSPGPATSLAGFFPTPEAARGFRFLTRKPYLPPDFDCETFDELWLTWPKPLREQARHASPEVRRQLAFARYGLIPWPARWEPVLPGLAPGATRPPMGYLDNGRGAWVMNCLMCHGGQVAGQAYPGLPNSNLALQTLIEDVRLTKLRLGKRLAHLDLGLLAMPLGGSLGTTNSVVFGIALEALRDADLEVHLDRPQPTYVHHDLDAPPYWNVKKKQRLYYDGLTPKGPRPLLQFVLVPSNSAATVRGWETEYRDILAWIESLEPPRYPWDIDRPLAAQGRTAFEKVCARCHGTYGPEPTYPNRVIDLADVGTDPLRLQAISLKHRQEFQHGWLGGYDRTTPVAEPRGYVAPPLDGIWASAPYLHNGSVPTLWHLLHPGERPIVWQRTPAGYDRERGGLEVSTFDAVPERAETAAERRTFFDTRLPGKSSAGHRFPEELTPDERRAVLEYLKTL